MYYAILNNFETANSIVCTRCKRAQAKLNFMKIFLTKKQDLITTTWSGGTTTQLAIYPPGSTLQERNFLFRISTAKVEAESSEFTRLPGIQRVIMILEGQLKLDHVGQYSKTLMKYETDIFSGDWKTRSRGKVTDFNLMTTGNASGTVEMVQIEKDQQMPFSFKEEGNILGFYVVMGTIKYMGDERNEILEPGDFLLAQSNKKEDLFSLKAIQDSEFILAKIKL
jgi:uncharacterized protein